MPDAQTIRVVFATTLRAEEWDIEPPIDLPVGALIAKLLRMPEFCLPEFNSRLKPIEYNLAWQEGRRNLDKHETLRTAGVKSTHTLILKPARDDSGNLQLQSQRTRTDIYRARSLARMEEP